MRYTIRFLGILSPYESRICCRPLPNTPIILSFRIISVKITARALRVSESVRVLFRLIRFGDVLNVKHIIWVANVMSTVSLRSWASPVFGSSSLDSIWDFWQTWVGICRSGFKTSEDPINSTDHCQFLTWCYFDWWWYICEIISGIRTLWWIHLYAKQHLSPFGQWYTLAAEFTCLTFPHRSEPSYGLPECISSYGTLYTSVLSFFFCWLKSLSASNF